MLEQLQRFLQHWSAITVPLVIFVGTLLAGYLAHLWLTQLLKRTRFGETTGGAEAVSSLRAPFTLWILMAAVHLATQFSTLQPRDADRITKILQVLWVVSLTVVASRLAAMLVRHYGARVHGGIQVTSLTENIARMLMATLGVLVLLNMFGISIAPLLTALGVGGLAVALALQDTLSNLFAGFYITLANQVRIGDYIKLNTGEEGYVSDISWRSVSIRMLSNNTIIVPNSKMAQANITNYHLPEKRMSLVINVRVSYESDPDHVERVLVEEAKAAASIVPGLLANPEPFSRLIPGFGEYFLEFSLIVQLSEFVDQYLVQHELRKRILKRFRQENIEIPYPIRILGDRGVPAPV